MSATNRMPKRTPWQAVQRIPIKSSTIRQSETSLRQVHYYATNRTNGDWAIQKQRPLRRQNVRKWQKLVPMATSLEVQRPNFAGIIYDGRPTSRRKNGEGRSRTFWANRTRSSTNQKQFWLPGSPEVIADSDTRQKTNFPAFSFLRTMCLSRVVLKLRRKKRNFRKRKLVAMATSFEKSKNQGPDRSSTAIAEPDGANRVKIRPVEVKIIGMTEIVKKEIIRYRSKTYGYTW